VSESTIVKRNGFEIERWYEGIDAYRIEKDGEEVYHGWDIGDVIRIVGCNPFEK